jgi:hypothetical protein
LENSRGVLFMTMKTFDSDKNRIYNNLFKDFGWAIG